MRAFNEKLAKVVDWGWESLFVLLACVVCCGNELNWFSTRDNTM